MGRLTGCLVLSRKALAHDQTLLIPVAEGDEDHELHAPTAKYSSDRSVNDTARSLFPARSTISLLLDSLPKNLHLEKEEKRQLDPHQQPSGLNTLQEEDEASDQEEETADQDAEAGLEIAWQYRKEVQQERLGQASSSHTSSLSTTNVFCKSYDLSGKLSSQLSWTDMDVVLEPLAHQTCGLRCFQQLWQALQTRRASSTAGVTRILLYHSDLHLISVMLPVLLASIRLEGLPVVVLVVTESSKESNCNVAKVLRRSCDVILEAEAFATRSIYPPPPEFREFQGVLKIRKMSTLTAAAAHGGGHFADVTTSKRLIASVYGLKRDRRKLHIKLLHIPPEDFAQGGGSVGTSGVRSGAGRKDAASSCAGGSSTLDF